MRAFFIGIVSIVFALLAIPFLTGYILHEGSFDYFLSIVGAILLLSAIFLLVSGRIGSGLLLLVFSGLVILYSKGYIQFGFIGGDFFYRSVYFAGIFIPCWIIMLALVLVLAGILRRN
jgi:hypothetical protein